MTEEMNNDMMELAKKHLPAQVCGELKEQLESLSELREENARLKASEKRLEAKVDKICNFEVRLSDLNAAEKTLLSDQIQLSEERQAFMVNKKVYELEQQLKAQQNISANAMQINSNLARNVEFRKSIYNNKSDDAYTDINGQYVNPKSSSESITETTEID